MSPTVPELADTAVVKGPVYLALFREKDNWAVPGYVGGAIYPSKKRGDMTFNKLKDYASSEGGNIFTKKILEKDEERPQGRPPSRIGGL